METFDEKSFWELYDRYLTNPTDKLRINLIPMIASHPAIHKLERPEKGWKKILAWELLKSVTLHSEDGRSRRFLPCGDIIIEQHDWDRDVYITHIPKEEFVSGGILGNSKQFDNELIGVFLPLYCTETIKEKIIQMFDENKKKAIAFLDEEEKNWPKQTK